MVRILSGFVGDMLTYSRLFIIDGVISLPVAIAGFFFLPDVPETSKAFYLSKDVSIYSASRSFSIAKAGAGIRVWKEEDAARGPRAEKALHQSEVQEDFVFVAHLPSKSIIRVSNTATKGLTKLTHARCFNNGAAGAAPVFAQFLKDSKHPKYTVSQINTYPTGTNAVQVVSTLIYAWFSDSVLNGRRWPPIVFGGVVNIICYVSLAIWDIPIGWKWACYYICGCGFGLSGLIMA
jgi:ACS family pantothenate transporter-like MFS transporter